MVCDRNTKYKIFDFISYFQFNKNYNKMRTYCDDTYGSGKWSFSHLDNFF